MDKQRDLLMRGYFPRELPPVFTTTSMSGVAKNWPAAPTTFSADNRKSEVCRHNIPRSGPLRRPLNIPNPVAYAMLCMEVDAGWVDIERHISQSDISRSAPTFFAGSARAMLPSVPDKSDLLPEIAAARARGRYLLRTDISRFYNSIYTHSLPWALHSKPVSKKRKTDMTMLGNRLDLRSRNLQDGQTMGIPIGPDTSLALSDIILSSIDADLKKKFSPVGFRYVDDYHLVFRTAAEAEDTLAYLQHALADFILDLNANKTGIDELPLPHEATWVREIRALPLRAGKATQRHDLLRVFDVAAEFARRNPQEHVMRYAIGRLRSADWHPENWPLLQHLLLQSLLFEPATLAYVIGYLVEGLDARRTLVNDLIAEVLNLLIVRHAPLGHGFEVAWATWGLLRLNLPLDSAATKALELTTDCPSILLALHARSNGAAPATLDTTQWEKMMTADELYGSNWLVAYEASIKGWLPSYHTKDHIARDRNFSWLRAQGVSFYDPTRIAGVMLTGVPPSVGVAPLFSL
jgi:hypothetical protein